MAQDDPAGYALVVKELVTLSKNEERTAQVPPQPQEGEMSESEIDRNLEDTFPASDPPSWTLGTDHGEAPEEDQG
jgi:hypothetical protein